ncbi:alpha/beta hydrolase [Peptococcaceae bacterium SCADC1_2_3]|jgi:hypothetical protein|nr:alpha/beta hydrolase [Peptococcaceae bacterium SCADC1_2_3]KFI34923.1 alpha/beta hydrolase [Peptococcaceae bacterium SCADC1_2_3]KFI38141.1 alpha/beta hydrolase [Peptococcaceae bacterium SCADC1_2_3]HCJ78673.1 alpha/beta hydrolase [Desulfotomaculum sp.]
MPEFLDYSIIDRSMVLNFIFYPRKIFTKCPTEAVDFFIPVDEKAHVSCRFYLKDKKLPSLLYFHGNGEVVSDYDEIAPFYHQIGLNLFVADYRGYGASTGTPNFSNLVKDAHAIFWAIKKELAQGNYHHDLFIMGRSLGSISALELASSYPANLKGLIIESGFAGVMCLLKYLGLTIKEDERLAALEQAILAKVKNIPVPVLIIHGEYDSLIPLKEGQKLFQSLTGKNKKLTIIPFADHNNIMLVGFKQYFAVLGSFVR